MNPPTIQNSDDILNFLAEVTLRGKGFTTDCLLDYVLDEGFTEPIYLNASGEDPDALYKNQPNAWAIYQIREWKRELISPSLGESLGLPKFLPLPNLRGIVRRAVSP